MINYYLGLTLYLFLVLLFLQYPIRTRERRLTKKKFTIVVLSDDFDWSTNIRLKYALKLYKELPGSQMAVCGKYKGSLMQKFLKKNSIKKYILQNKSTNTLEDAKYLVKMLPLGSMQNILLVTSSFHQRRAYHTFRKIFKGKILNMPANDLLNLYSPFLPTGWFVCLLNIYKDYRYNGKII